MAALGPGPGDRLVLVTVGSDYHPFTRLVEWVDAYQATRRRDDVSYMCQHGPGRPMRTGTNRPYLRHPDLLQLLDRSAVVITHGGPSSLIESLRSGHVPIAVPRRGSLEEAVDDHQQVFCTFLEERGEAVVAHTSQELCMALDRALSEPAAFRTSGASWDADIERTIGEFSRLVEGCSTRRASLARRIVRRRWVPS